MRHIDIIDALDHDTILWYEGGAYIGHDDQVDLLSLVREPVETFSVRVHRPDVEWEVLEEAIAERDLSKALEILGLLE